MSGGRRSLSERYPRRVDIPLLILSSAVLLAFGLAMPVLTVRKIWEVNTFSILAGIESLWQEKQRFLALVVFFFSVIFPIFKLCALAVLWVVELAEAQRNALIHGLLLLGKWSMLDVFIVAVIIVSVKLGVLASAKPEHGIYYFAASVMLSMIATSLLHRLAGNLNSS